MYCASEVPCDKQKAHLEFWREETIYSGGRCGRWFHGHKFLPSHCVAPPLATPSIQGLNLFFHRFSPGLALWFLLMNRLWQKWFGVSCGGLPVSAFTLLECFWNVKKLTGRKEPTTGQHQPPATWVRPARPSQPWVDHQLVTNVQPTPLWAERLPSWDQLQLLTHK